MIGSIVCAVVELFMLIVFYFVIGFMTADLTNDWWKGEKKKGRTVLFWPYVLVKLAYKNIRGMSEHWEW